MGLLIEDALSDMLIWVKQKRNVEYYEEDLRKMKNENEHFYEAMGKTWENAEIVYEYLNRLIQHYEEKA